MRTNSPDEDRLQKRNTVVLLRSFVLPLSFMGSIERIQWSLIGSPGIGLSVHIMGPANEKSLCPVHAVFALPKNFYPVREGVTCDI